MKEKLIQFIKDKYDPVAIILHGSRANGHERAHSDWDFIIFTKSNVNPHRDIQFGENFEIKQVILPASDDELQKDSLAFLLRNENQDVVYDPEGITPDLLTRSEEILKKGNNFGEVSRRARFAFLKSALDGMKDYKDNPMIFFSKKFDFYDRAVPAWFRFLHKEFKPSDYLALPRINHDDPEFFNMLENFVRSSPEESIVLGQDIIDHLFPDISI
jgi:predicted nucleotidyltransferase